jgi:CRISPR-associated protein Csx3
MLYNVNVSVVADKVTLLNIGFGEAASNEEIVKEVAETAKAVLPEIGEGKILLINGPASLPIAFVLAHAFGHIAKAVAVKDPKIGGFVTVISHGGPTIGTVLGEDGLPKE